MLTRRANNSNNPIVAGFRRPMDSSMLRGAGGLYYGCSRNCGSGGDFQKRFSFFKKKESQILRYREFSYYRKHNLRFPFIYRAVGLAEMEMNKKRKKCLHKIIHGFRLTYGQYILYNQNIMNAHKNIAHILLIIGGREWTRRRRHSI